MDKALTVLSTDWHLSKSNIEQIKDLIRQKIQLAQKLNVDTVFCTGDIFNSRKAQEQIVLNAFGDILQMFEEAEIKLVAIAGNHDKVNLDSELSYLTEFKHHPYFELIEEYGVVTLGFDKEIFDFHLIPFFSENKYLEILSKFKKTGNDDEFNFLLSHQSVEGTKNNDGSLVHTNLKLSDFKEFDAIFFGHYHNRSKIGNVQYIGSLQQNNFGEDPEKGFTVIYGDGSYQFFNSIFRKFEKISLDVDKLSAKEFKAEIVKHTGKNKDSNIRIELSGCEERLKSLDIDMIKQMGFDVKLKSKEIEAHFEAAEKGERLEFTTDSILQEFQNFCEQEKIEDINVGNKYLTKILNK